MAVCAFFIVFDLEGESERGDRRRKRKKINRKREGRMKIRKEERARAGKKRETQTCSDAQ